MRYWETLYSEDDAPFDREVKLDARNLPPLVTWGTSPENVITVEGKVPDPAAIADHDKRKSVERSLAYMGLDAGNARSRTSPSSASSSAPAPTAASRISAPPRRSSPASTCTKASTPWSCPAPGLVKEQAEAEGLDKIFLAAGFEWREPGCSMCLAMNDDRLRPGERCASTSNRNFEGRQGFKGRTHLVSPIMAAAAAIAGRFVDVRKWNG